MNTFELQRAIRDDDDLNAGEVAVLLILTTYLPNVAPSVETIARGCRMNAKSVRRILKRLEGRWLRRTLRPGKPSIYTLDPGTERPYHRKTLPSKDQGSFDTRHPTIERPPEETIRDLVSTTYEDTKTSARDRLARWSGVWDQVVGVGPLPSLDELRRWRPKVTEAHLSATLGEVAGAVAAGVAKSPRALFFARLKATIGKPAPTTWSQEQVLNALRPASSTAPPDLRRPDLRPPVIAPPLVETPDQRLARRSTAAAGLDQLAEALKDKQ